jgi:SAM-dependent methyltransferase
MDAYKTDLAYIHDAGFTAFARGAAPFLLDTLRKAGFTDGLVVDLGCGSGVWARKLMNAGYQVLGIDISPAMIELARQRVPEGEFRVGSLLKVDLPACIAVTSLGECFNYLFDRENSKKQVVKVFRRIHAALQLGGLFLFDVAQTGRGTPARTSYVEGPDWGVAVHLKEDRKTRRLTRDIVSYRKVGDLFRRDHEVHELQLYQCSELARELRRLGFTARLLRGYGKQRFPKGYGGVLARKSSA